MVTIQGVYIGLRSEAPERLAAFYERLLGLERETSGSGVILKGPGLTIAIRSGAGEPAGDAGADIGFRAPDGVDPARVRADAVACGAVVLSESKRDGLASITFQDPDGHAFVLVAVAPSVTADAAPVRVAPAPPDAPVDVKPPAMPAATPPPAVLPTVVAPPGGTRPTRRDVDRLRDMERLASMQESIAGLNMAFEDDDPAAVMDRMRSKIPVVSEAEHRAREADAAMRAREREAAVDDMLAQYRAQVRNDSPAPQPPPAPQPVPVAPSEAPPPPAAPVPEPPTAPAPAPTLAPSSETSADQEEDEIRYGQPRTLGRSRSVDDEDASGSGGD